MGAVPGLALGFQIMLLDKKAKQYRYARERYDEEHERITERIEALSRR